MGIWIATAHGLPREDEAVQFALGSRRVPLRGRYRRGEFATRWWRYPAWTVERWCAINRSAERATHPGPAAALDHHLAAAM
ncbi:MAG TPA: hypothetical protein VFS55_14005 [Dokdonella sp.]|nr:hypothetical protein [Dokdonella sp.]